MKRVLVLTIQLSKPLRSLTWQAKLTIKNGMTYVLKPLLMQANMQVSPLRGLVGSRVGLIPHQLYIAHEVGKRFCTPCPYWLMKLV